MKSTPFQSKTKWIQKDHQSLFLCFKTNAKNEASTLSSKCFNGLEKQINSNPRLTQLTTQIFNIRVLFTTKATVVFTILIQNLFFIEQCKSYSKYWK